MNEECNLHVASIFRYFTYLTKCKNPKACTILLRGASKDILNEVERNLQDAMNVARNVMQEPYLIPGGGAAEMALAQVRVYLHIFKYMKQMKIISRIIIMLSTSDFAPTLSSSDDISVLRSSLIISRVKPCCVDGTTCCQ